MKLQSPAKSSFASNDYEILDLWYDAADVPLQEEVAKPLGSMSVAREQAHKINCTVDHQAY